MSDIGIPYAAAGFSVDGCYGVTCPECGAFIRPLGNPKSEVAIIKGAKRAYGVHYSEQHGSS